MITARTQEVFGGWTDQTRAGLYVPAGTAPAAKPIGIDLFAGAGGFSCGFHQAGWDVVAAVEFDFTAALTYLTNLGGPDTIVHVGPGAKLSRKVWSDWTHDRADDVTDSAGTGWIADEPDQQPCRHLWICDIRDLTGAWMLAELGLRAGGVGCVFGGPPCQGFSKANPHRSPQDTRNTLVFQFARLVLEIHPATMVMENVPEMLSMVTAEGVPVVDALARVLADGGFSTYDALKRSIAGTHGTSGAVRRTRAGPVAADEGNDQLDLFEAVGGP